MDINLERKGLEQRFYDLCAPIVESNGLKLYDLDYIIGGQTLRLYITNPETKTAVIEECARVDRALSEPFETLDWIPENITLEVSSPGIYKNLRMKAHFVEARGDQISVVLFKNKAQELPELKKVHKLTGILEEVEEDQIVVSANEKKYNLPYEIIKKANSDPDLAELL